MSNDYNRYLVAVSYNSGRAYAMWVYNMEVEGISISWDDSAECPYSGAMKHELEEKLCDDNITMVHSSLFIGTSDIESIWVIHQYIGSDGYKK